MSIVAERPGLEYKHGRWWRKRIPRVLYCAECWQEVHIVVDPYVRWEAIRARAVEQHRKDRPMCLCVSMLPVTRKGRQRRKESHA